MGFSRKILVKVQLDLAGRGWLQYSYFQKRELGIIFEDQQHCLGGEDFIKRDEKEQELKSYVVGGVGHSCGTRTWESHGGQDSSIEHLMPL